MGDKHALRDLEVAEIAKRQFGIVTSRQLGEAGIDANAARRRVLAGRLHRLYPGVYAVGHLGLSNEGRWLAAALAFGDRAVVSHRSAAAVWKLLPPPQGPIDVMLSGLGGRPKRSGIRLHRSTTLRPREMTRHRGIPVTTAARTLGDLRRTVSASFLRRAMREAAVLGLHTGSGAGTEPTRSELEHRFLRLCGRHRLPTPATNVQIGAFIVDFLWRDWSLVAETDGYRYHRALEAFEQDRARDVQLRLMGYTVARFTYRQVTEEGSQVAAALRQLLRPQATKSR
jgi:very-short-patch-repair endonuclease